ncbi:ABC transporter substrate-binding protein [Salinibacterium sp. G-O1]|uniref:ABC transporter substrate-binding protein n=1 Tax=Salinibacterium sp. G-O1 TaxID=3046208 RepID=UPI0024B94239|nr:ABC transporter substrate-binding protein [Salinibacterium sp. G-O1]MDJ0336236.1 ABC transporter substrate-binding protein [Salinibacterium sp. G-O1]
MMLNNWKGLVPTLAVGAVVVLGVTGCSTGGSGGDGGGDAGGDTIKIGVLATSEGNLAFGMGEAKAAIAVAMEAIGGTVDGGEIGGKSIEIIYAGTDGTSGSAQTQVKKLVENDDVDIVFGPVSGDEGEAVVQYALTVPEVTFVNGSASPVGMTLEGAENFFRFHGDSAMWMGGLGDYAYDEKGYKKIYSIAEDYSFPYDNAGGFFSEFCAAGGEVNGNSWVPVGTTDYATIIAQIPADTDAVYVGLGGADAASFLSQAVTNGVDLPLVGGSIAVDTTALSGDANIASAAVGTITGGPVPGAGYDNPEWQPFVDAYVTQPDAFPSPSIFSILYYNSFQSLVLGLQEVDGDLSDGHAGLRDALGSLDWNSPTGQISMDENRQAIVDNFLIEVLDEGGTLVQKNISEASGVTQGTTVYDRFEGCP